MIQNLPKIGTLEKPVFQAEFVENRQRFFSHTKCPTSMKKLRFRLLISVNGKWVKLSITFNLLKKHPVCHLSNKKEHY